MSTVDAHSARFAQMCEAARGKADVFEALRSAGFTMTEITDNHTDVIAELQRESQTGEREALA